MNKTISESLKGIRGALWIHKIHADGSKELLLEKTNVILDVGKDFLAQWLKQSQASGFMEYIAVGSDDTAAQASDTSLGSELARVQGTLTTPGTTNILQNTATFGAGAGTGAWKEAALYSASSGGTAFSRQTFGVLTKGSLDTFSITWQITLG